MTLPSDLPIGVFDSGIGGLTVVHALRRKLPHEHIVYFGDTARVPYGVKSPDTIRHYATQITDFLLERQIKLLIIACNTVAAVAADSVRARTTLPVLDVIEAGSATAVGATRTRRVGVIGTLTTIGSGAYDQAIRNRDAGISIRSQACPLFVPLVEEGWLDHDVTRLTAREYLAPLLQDGIDTLVLGCTHYPLLQPLLQEVAGPGVRLVDSAETTANRAAQELAALGLLRGEKRAGQLDCFVTDVPQRFRQLGEQFLGEPLHTIERVHW